MENLPESTGPSPFLTPKQQEYAKQVAAEKIQKLQQAQVERLKGIVEKILEILVEQRVTTSEWQTIVPAIDKKVNIKINQAEFGTILNL